MAPAAAADLTMPDGAAAAAARPAAPTAAAGTLTARHLSRTLRGALLSPALTLSLPPGHVAFFRGPSGCGKSTALRLLAALDPPDPAPSAALALGAHTPASLSPPAWRTRVHLVAQARVALPGSPADLLTRAAGLQARAHPSTAPPPSVAALTAAAAALGLPQDALDREWAALSGGENARAALALALALRPACLLLDEVTSALDAPAARRAEEAIASLARDGAAVVMVTHDEEQPARMQALLPEGHTQVVLFGQTAERIVCAGGEAV